jgi:hypothetical protein
LRSFKGDRSWWGAAPACLRRSLIQHVIQSLNKPNRLPVSCRLHVQSHQHPRIALVPISCFIQRRMPPLRWEQSAQSPLSRMHVVTITLGSATDLRFFLTHRQNGSRSFEICTWSLMVCEGVREDCNVGLAGEINPRDPRSVSVRRIYTAKSPQRQLVKVMRDWNKCKRLAE